MEQFLTYCQTERQTEILTAVIEHRSAKTAADKLGINVRNVHRTIERVKGYAKTLGFDPEIGLSIAPKPGMGWQGTSAHYNEQGQVTAQWVKYKPDSAQQELLLQEYIKSLAEGIKPETPIQSPEVTNNTLLNCYTISDYHLGSLSWHEETGEDWDTAIAEDMLVAWFAKAISLAPDARVGLLAQLGDFLHFDGLAAVTPTSGHMLDTDTRFQRVVRVAIKALRRIIRMLLEKHETVHVLMAEGNHDLAASAWLRELLFALYEEEPRITVDRSASPYYAYEHGNTSLFFHHGHKRKPERIAEVFAAQFRDLYGKTEHSYAHLGHLHHDKLLETNLMTIEQHRTIAAPDAYAAKGGWISGRGAKVITYAEDYGEVGRVIISPDMVNGF